MKFRVASLVILGLVAAGCGTPERTDGVVRIYTSVTQDTVDAVLAGFESDTEIEVFRAPTGDLAARIATEQRQGGVVADVLWLTDPLSMQQYSSEGLLQSWRPDNAESVPEEYLTETFIGTRILTVVAVQQADSDAIEGWLDMASTRLVDQVVLPDPGFAGSAFGAMGYFALERGFGFDWYRALAANGVTQVSSPGDVITAVAEGRFLVGMTLDGPARSAIANGSPIEIVYPAPGAVAIYSPIAVLEGADDGAKDFVEHVLSVEGQTAIAGTGWQPVRADVDWNEGSGPLVYPDWVTMFDRQDELLDEYRSIVPG